MARPKNPENYYKPAPMPKGEATAKGMAGYDNPRENIDPHIKTKVLDTKELVVSGALININNYIPYTGATKDIDLNNHTMYTGGGIECDIMTVDTLLQCGNVISFEDQIYDLGSTGSKWGSVYCMALNVNNPATLTISDVGNLITIGKISGASLTAANGFTGTGTYTTLKISGGIILSAS